MIRISSVSYLNTAPFIYGIKESGILSPNEYFLSRDFPSICAKKLIQGEADIGIVPVAALPSLPNFNILGNTCIGAIGKIDSVLLLSEVPLEDITEILLDYQSLTSVNLCRILADHHWKINPTWIKASEGYIQSIKGPRAGVVIGDRALEYQHAFPFQYDLAEAWMRYTGLPFVFACWVYSNAVDQSFLSKLELALEYGVNHIDDIASIEEKNYPEKYQVKNYLKHRVSYHFDDDKKKAMQKYLSLVDNLMAIDLI